MEFVELRDLFMGKGKKEMIVAENKDSNFEITTDVSAANYGAMKRVLGKGLEDKWLEHWNMLQLVLEGLLEQAMKHKLAREMLKDILAEVTRGKGEQKYEERIVDLYGRAKNCQDMLQAMRDKEQDEGIWRWLISSGMMENPTPEEISGVTSGARLDLLMPSSQQLYFLSKPLFFKGALEESLQCFSDENTMKDEMDDDDTAPRGPLVVLLCDPRQEVLKAVLLAVIREAMINERECLFYLSNHEVEPFVVGSKQAAIELAYLVTHEMKIKNNWETMLGCFVEWQAEDRLRQRRRKSKC